MDPKRLRELRERHAKIPQEADAIVAKATAEKRELSDADVEAIEKLKAEQETVAQQISMEERRLKAASAFPRQSTADLDLGASRVEVGDDLSTKKPFRNFGEYLQAVAAASTPPGDRYGRFRTGTVDPALMPLQAGPSGMSVGTPSDGGFLVQKMHTDVLLKKAREASMLLPLVTTIPIGEGADGVEAPYIDETSRATGSRWGGVQVYRRAEADTVTATKPKIGKWSLDLEDMMALAYATERSLRDASSLGALLEDAFQSEFAFKIDDEIFRGSGVGQCLGILNSSALVTQAAEGGQAADTVVAANVQKMFARVPAKWLSSSVWLMNQEIWPQLFAMNQANMPIFLAGGSLANAPLGTLLGRPIVAIEQASAIGDVGDIVFASMGRYVVIEKDGIVAADSIHVRFIQNERTFRWTWRNNGQPKEKSTITPYKGANTLGPFVALAAR